MGSVAHDSPFSKVDDSAAKAVGELQLRNYVKFMGDYAQQLSNIEGALDEHQSLLWNKSLTPIIFQTKPEEKVSLLNLIRTDNRVLNKVLIAFSALCIEVDTLSDEAEKDFYDPLMFYGEEVSDAENSPPSDGEIQLQVGRMLPLLQRLSCFLQRCKETLKNMIQQLAALRNKSMPNVMDTTNIHFGYVYEHIAKLLRVVITIDETIASNAVLQNHWSQYKMMLKQVNLNPGSFGVEADKLKPLEKLMIRLEKQIISSKLLDSCLNQDFDDSGIPVTKNSYFAEEFTYNLKLMFLRTDMRLGDPTEVNHRLQYVGLCSLFVLQYRLFHTLDRKLFRQVWDVQRKLPCVCLLDHVTWFPDEFLAVNMPPTSKVVDRKMQDQAVQYRSGWLSSKIQSLTKECQQYCAAVNNWTVKMTSGPEQDKSLEDLAAKSKTFIEGVCLAYSIRHTVETVMNLHANTKKPMTKTEVLTLCRMMALSKAVADGFHCAAMQIAECTSHVVQYLQLQVLNVLQAAKKRAVVDKKYSDRRLDILSALVQCETSVAGSPTKQRLIVAQLALTVANQSKIIRDDEHASLLERFEQLDVIGAHGVCAFSKTASDQSSFYWHRTLFETYLGGLCDDPTFAARLQYMMDVMEDCVFRLRRCKHLASANQIVQGYKNEVNLYLRQNLLDKVCKDIENDLRLSVHTHLKLDDRNPFRVGVKSLRQLLTIPPIRFMGCFLDIKAYVTHYLDKTFYNLTTVALHDWRTYGEMRNLAAQKYQLEMQEVHLPNQQLEQGLDVLEIMRNIHVFVSKYLYNLNNQIFVERSSNNKHLNTINIRHIANSIRTHGTGIMNTTVRRLFVLLQCVYAAEYCPTNFQKANLTQCVYGRCKRMRTTRAFRVVCSFKFSARFVVFENVNVSAIFSIHSMLGYFTCVVFSTSLLFQVNFTFQFLKKKFYIFSQFLFDEHIKSRLVKDMRDFRENREALNQQYPFEQADKFNRGIRKLGLSADGSSYLDQFRLLISHIGNAMGYIRMVRSGGLHCCSNAIRFVPDVEDVVSFEELARAENISEEVTTSFAHIDAVIGSLAKNSAEGSDYLRMLVDVFAPEFRSSKNMHLRNFYAIIPAMTVNFVEHIISCKEKMNKKNKLGAAFTDDGFAMGLAYILKLLGQYSDFDALHWFQSVRRKYSTDIRSQQQPMKQSRDAEDEKLLQTKALALKRIGIYQREFDLLYYSLSSARIFFRGDVKEEAAGAEDSKASTTDTDPEKTAGEAAPVSS